MFIYQKMVYRNSQFGLLGVWFANFHNRESLSYFSICCMELRFCDVIPRLYIESFCQSSIYFRDT